MGIIDYPRQYGWNMLYPPYFPCDDLSESILERSPLRLGLGIVTETNRYLCLNPYARGLMEPILSHFTVDHLAASNITR